jgi:hypothetical protein
MGARWYDPALGRWLSADTLVPEPGNPQAFNKYSFVVGNPLRHIDPSGHGICDEPGGGPDNPDCQAREEDQPPTLEEIIIETLQGMEDVIFDPERTEPIQIPLGDGTILVIMPVDSDPFQDRSGVEWLGGASEVIGILGAVNDGIEGLALVTGGPFGPADFFAGTDTILAGAVSACSGDMWFGKPHPDLPAMWLLGQDVLWTAGVDGVGPHFVGAVGAMFTGNLGGYAVGKWGGDFGTTLLSIGYDIGRAKGNVPTLVNAGWGWSSQGGLQGYVVVYP